MMYDAASGGFGDAKVSVLSTEGMLKHVAASPSQNFVVATEVGILYRMRKQNPTKNFVPASENAECQYMKMITLPKVLRSLREEVFEVKVPEATADRAKKSIDRMLEITA